MTDERVGLFVEYFLADFSGSGNEEFLVHFSKFTLQLSFSGASLRLLFLFC